MRRRSQVMLGSQTRGLTTRPEAVVPEGGQRCAPLEAAFIGAQLRDIPIEQLTPVLNLGSSNAEFRRRTHPHVDQEISFRWKRAARASSMRT